MSLVNSNLWFGERDFKKFQDAGFFVVRNFLTDDGLQVRFFHFYFLSEADDLYVVVEKQGGHYLSRERPIRGWRMDP
jgi:hypothetical protein